MRNWKTSTIAILTALIALMTGTKEYLSSGSIPDIGLIAAAQILPVAQSIESQLTEQPTGETQQ